ncbi:hypothetical protein ARAM_000455 [Aspergillus rambellii]|uniref:Nephrocystin 3-like N-terminal domain-containing protein n=1 Tax=Aspergillus rambellii TaxID=308745 RepID=A0A0F8XCT0_9EURO|nr:hypothetical protein ARAM_000455 [Aspergillus rambellii]
MRTHSRPSSYPRNQVRLVRALAKQQTQSNDQFDDLITNKGKGCMFLLHGPPGVGKTATVESIADEIKRPFSSSAFGNISAVIIMFLTTNRVDAIDPAFRSRIHLMLSYRPLQKEAHMQLWRLFLKRTSSYSEADWTEETTLASFAQVDPNGRQIKNAVRTAHSLALSDGKKLSAEEVQVVLDTIVEFEEDFSNLPQRLG